MSDTKANAEILREFFSRVWEHGDLDAIDDLFIPDAHADGILPDMGLGPDEFKVLVATVLELITTPKVTMNKSVEQGNWASGFLSVEAEKLDTRTPIHITLMVLCRFRDGKIVEAYNNVDYISFFEQMGILPENTVAMGMSGMAIA
ncbi:nuclear transport factor 2 family protein [Thalassovita sp.]|uniref:ester cyclase n=1 Tax=Thalassovita sp. TaxID=1979401 RepID=UPI002B265ED1|nr:nuclear transport factor 2 family protein [Thalassovita sp.]